MSTLDTRDLEDEIIELEEANDSDDRERLEALRELRHEIGGDWYGGIQLIPEHEFEDYARQFAEDIGAIDDNTRWPCTCIDWEQAAGELAMDYSSITFDGTDYYWRE